MSSRTQEEAKNMTVYIYTLDSHDCFGPFDSYDAAHAWARLRQFSSYQLLLKPPYASTLVHKP